MNYFLLLLFGVSLLLSKEVLFIALINAIITMLSIIVVAAKTTNDLNKSSGRDNPIRLKKIIDNVKTSNPNCKIILFIIFESF